MAANIRKGPHATGTLSSIFAASRLVARALHAGCHAVSSLTSYIAIHGPATANRLSPIGLHLTT